MNPSLGLAAVSLAVALQPLPAFAQELPCPVCRAQIPFGNCTTAAIANPPPGRIGLTVRVVQAESMQCATRLVVNVERASQRGLPARVTIEVHPCLFWSGKTGEEINAMVLDTPSEGGAYLARTCN
jgi:hypothetical protein